MADFIYQDTGGFTWQRTGDFIYTPVPITALETLIQFVLNIDQGRSLDLHIDRSRSFTLNIDQARDFDLEL